MKRLGGIVAALILGLSGAAIATPAHAATGISPPTPTQPEIIDSSDGSVTITPAASTYINVKNSVNSDYQVRVYRDFTPDREVHYLWQGENAVLYNGDGSVRIKIYVSQSIDSFQYYYGGSWKSCHDWAPDITNPTNDYYDVTIRTFYSGDCDGRN